MQKLVKLCSPNYCLTAQINIAVERIGDDHFAAVYFFEFEIIFSAVAMSPEDAGDGRNKYDKKTDPRLRSDARDDRDDKTQKEKNRCAGFNNRHVSEFSVAFRTKRRV